MNDKQGSIWRKWDLHIHTPASFNWRGDLDYLKVIEQINTCEAEAFVVSDYWTFDGYKELLNINERLGEDQKIKKELIPGIELRFDILTDGRNRQRVNFQVILNNTGTKDEVFARLDQFYNKLKLCDTDKLISRNSFIELAKDYPDDVLTALVGKNREECNDFDYYLAGCKHCHVSYACIFEILKDKDLVDHILIIVPWDKYGGINKIDPILRDDTKKKLTKLASFIESTNQETRKLFLLDNSFLISKSWANSWRQFLDDKQKPCISGSDSHSLDTYGDSSCWIKADLTFEGLKQVVYEPEVRVRVQENNPYEDNNKIFFSKVSLDGSKNFKIPDTKLSLNRELVTLIGGRGSGKSALLESIAFLNEEHIKVDSNNKKKIIEYYRANVENKNPTPSFNLSVDLVDKDGSVESFSKSLGDEQDIGLPFLYIGQEQLSALATNDKELTQKICELLNIDFFDVKHNNLKDKAREIISDIYNLQAEVQDLYKKYPDYKDGDFETWITRYIKQKESQKAKLSSKTTRNLLEEISKFVDRGLKLKDYKNEAETLVESLQSISVNKTINELNELEKDLYGKEAELLPEIELKVQSNAIKKKVAKLDRDMAILRRNIRERKDRLSKLGLKEDISVLLRAAEVIQREINSASKDKVLYNQKNKKLRTLSKLRNQIYTDIQKRLKGLVKTINEKFVEFKNSRDESTADEKELFTRVTNGINIQGEVIFNQEVFCKHVLEEYVDRRSIKNEEELKAVIAKKDSRGQANDITLDILKTWVRTELDTFIKSDLLNTRGGNSLIGYLFIDWDKFITVRTSVKLNGVSTEKLSVGQRGTLLLKIYLATATAKQIFIVDQPEDNLDNSFIMNELVPLIREIKKSRQIILSTHNANLVVNADAEQVIVARLDNENNYLSGAIEDPDINKNIKEILEGGEEAFRNREDKYGMRTLHLQ